MLRQEFYKSIRESLYAQGLPQIAVDNYEVILSHIQANNLPIWDASYILATGYHEVGSNLVPIRENLNYTKAETIVKTWPKRFTLETAKAYVKKPQALANKVYGGRLGNNQQDDGWFYRGGGYSQITGRDHYRKFGELLGIDLEKTPSIILHPDIAARVMIIGMTRGLYTGKRLADFRGDYVAARAVVNADVAANGAKIAGYAVKFERALTAAGYGKIPSIPVLPAGIPSKLPSIPRVGHTGFLGIVSLALGAVYYAVGEKFEAAWNWLGSLF